jgi:hypothetical protein
VLSICAYRGEPPFETIRASKVRRTLVTFG